MSVGIGRERQFEVYVGGARGSYPAVPVSFARLEQAARSRMSPEGFAYVAGGAGTEETMRENRAAFERWRIVPRMLHDVSSRDTSLEVLGTRLPSPFVLCPIGVLEMAHRDADVAVARAAAAEGIPFVFSNQASRPMEETARAMGDAPRWFQLYWSTSNELVASLVSRAEACGCSAIVLTLDTTMLGWRVRDLDLAYLPFLRGKGIAQYTSDPVFVDALQETLRQAHLRPAASASRRSGRSGSSPARIRHAPAGPPFRARASRSAPVRRDVLATVALVGRPRLPARADAAPDPPEGHPAPARRGARRSSTAWTGSWSRTTAGARSTARSRRWTRCRASSRPSAGRVPVLLDSGVRSGADVFRALALGAAAVGLGRPYVWGLAAGGQEGVREVIRNLRADFDLTMGLAGCASVREIGRDSVVRPG